MKDIATAAGVNTSTVSRALDPAKRHLVSADTVERIERTAKRLGYRGDRVAGALRRGSTGTVGVIVADLANPFIAPIIHGIAQAIIPQQMLPMVIETGDDPGRLETCLSHVLSRRVDAVVVAGARFGNRAALEAASRHTPVVVTARGLPGSSLPQVLHDDRAGGALAARHLIELGHARVAELRGPNDVGNFASRHDGFTRECRDAGVEVVQLPVLGERPTRADGERLTRVLLDLHGDDMPTAVFAHNDLMALGVLRAFRERGVSCPGDVSLVGYNNTPTMDQINPPLTTVIYPGIQVGHAAGELALRLITDPGGATHGALFPPQLSARASTSWPRAGAGHSGGQPSET